MTEFVAGNNVKDTQEANQIMARHMKEEGKSKTFYGTPLNRKGEDPRDGKEVRTLNADWVLGNPAPMRVDKEKEERIYINNGLERVRIYHPSKVEKVEGGGLKLKE